MLGQLLNCNDWHTRIIAPTHASTHCTQCFLGVRNERLGLADPKETVSVFVGSWVGAMRVEYLPQLPTHRCSQCASTAGACPDPGRFNKRIAGETSVNTRRMNSHESLKLSIDACCMT